MLQLGCSSPSHMSSTPASPNLFSPMCSTFKFLFTLRAELTALQQAVVSPHSLTLQGKSDMRSRVGGSREYQVLFASSHSLHGSPDCGNRGTKAFPQPLYSCQPLIRSILSKQHLSHSLYSGCLSWSVHLGKAPAHKAPE